MSEETLLGSVEPVAEPVPGAEEGQAWFVSEDNQGEGEAPEWLKTDKYKSVYDQAKAYGDAEKRLGAFTGAPDEYEVKLSEDLELPEGVDFELDKESELLTGFTAWAKENNVSQGAFQDIVGMYVKGQISDLQAGQERSESSMAAEKELLGPNADARLSEAAKWGAANLDAEMNEKFKDTLTTAASVEVIEYIIGKTRNAQMPDPTNINPNLAANKKLELEEMQGAKDESGQLKWFTDPVHRARIEALQLEVAGPGDYRRVAG